MQPDVSFVIAAFNAERSIARAIESALAQRDVTVEVVVVDDCSTDRTVEVARSFPAELVRVVELEKNRGPGGARNAGLEIARGRWIAVLDSDDVVYPDRLARMIRRAETADAQIAVDNLGVVQETSGTKTIMFAPAQLAKFSELRLADFIGANMLFEETFSFGYMKPIFERRFIERNALRYIETLRIGEDYVFLASALARGGRCIVVPEPGYAYHIRSSSISRVLKLDHVEAMMAADEAFVRDHPLDPAAQAAQARRVRSLEEAKSFLTIVQHLKQHAPLKAMKTALRDPMAVRHLRMPIAARLRRLGTPFCSRKTLQQTG
ncbi:glycosyltransferase family 2 protein [Pseudaminobacter sp. 19-2017]|uniref:Glycosyltransferase family 2 protein n=1 Tax=Pseudaminobacter soli (ex Zhang et al. 2022) TaxID=2831468 RepID=A0A942DWR1_9HYPH|nr:glycosyltransferase family 2 protein [Pseudaminobacter soli]MBS3648601.1 glycosyltransferase family 2 protein [Pseudaminobacter soli]